ncbi:DeoR/GlpR family DNA-binding transcription regulator [Flaviaesturariibacter amylovorans]|uniref:DeoR/GlpR family DNA-binding transcription regulator n=1 Tax=Flaviaesturariibacter amylovorans TaxID=1084520 RepID=A0ABP8GMN1_9BACT
MLKRERQEFIIHQLHLHNKVLSTDLSQKISVSEDTIRRDLAELAEAGRIIKVHGGAISCSFRPALGNADIYSLEQKKIIAQKAINLIQDGMFVFTTGGTTIIELARCLPERLQATFITGSLPAAYEYIRHPNLEVIFIGDRVSRDAQLTVGPDAVARIGQFNADLCFLGTNALHVTQGLTDSDLEVAQVKRAMIERSARVVSLSISEKIDTVQKIQVCPLSRIHTIITELPPEAPLLEHYRKTGLEIL